MSELTTEVTVTCSYCNEVVTVPFRHGAVMPLHSEEGRVGVWVPRLDGDHDCQSDRHQREREVYLRTYHPS